ncbi:MAG TPA: JAB domain-containing protein [Euzebyales bacterium]|nr:JAB domain-containing protein [Euzebyales bacterium]
MQPCPLMIAGGVGFRPGPPGERRLITTPDDAVALLRPLLSGHDRERAVLVALDVRHRVIATRLISIGTAAHTFLGPREIFRDALDLGASAIVVAHNHPSGDASPSDDDRVVTRRLAQAGATLGVELLDHVIIGDPEWSSLARDGVCGRGAFATAPVTA